MNDVYATIKNDIGADIVRLAITQANLLGVSVSESLNDSTEFTNKLVDDLAAAVGTEGFDRAWLAATDALALKLTSESIKQADELDGRFADFLSGILRIAANALTSYLVDEA